MKFIISALLLFGVIWILMFLATLFGLIGMMILRIFIIFGIPTIVIVSIYKLLKR